MNIEKSTLQTSQVSQKNPAAGKVPDSSQNFSESLKSLSKINSSDEKKLNSEENTADTKDAKGIEETQKPEENPKVEENTEEEMDDAIGGLEEAVNEVNKLNQEDENNSSSLKDETDLSDIKDKHKDNPLINNEMNIPDPNEKLINPQLSTNMQFNSDGQPFTSFMNNSNEKKTLSLSEKDLAEEKAILSTMEENIALANKNRVLKGESEIKTRTDENGIKRVNTNTNITAETVVKFDTVAVSKEDADFFINLVNNNLPENVQNPEKSLRVSKTLADLLVKAMNDNKPVRINFDNDISVIIKIGRDGKISADFLPSSQVAEAYLKENLPLLRQRFEENNIEYDELNRREQRQNDRNNQKKERKDE